MQVQYQLEGGVEITPFFCECISGCLRRGAESAGALPELYSFLVALLMRDLWMWGITPPPAMVACTSQKPVSAALLGLHETISLLTNTNVLLYTGPHSRHISDSTARDLRVGSHLDEGVQLLVTTDGQLQMAGCDTLHLQATKKHVRHSCDRPRNCRKYLLSG